MKTTIDCVGGAEKALAMKRTKNSFWCKIKLGVGSIQYSTLKKVKFKQQIPLAAKKYILKIGEPPSYD